MHFQAIGKPFCLWTTMEEGIRLVFTLNILEWISYALRPLPQDVSFTHGLQQHLPTASPSELLLLLVSLLVKGMAVMQCR